MDKVKVKVLYDLDEKSTEGSFLVYQENLEFHSLSVQTKPELSKKEFIELCQNSHIYKIIITIDDNIEGIILAADSPAYYPESHYSNEYFSPRGQKRHSFKKTIFFIGDRGGVNLSKTIKKKIKQEEIDTKGLFKEIFSIIKMFIHSDFDVIWNQSEHADRMTLMRDPSLDLLGAIRQISEVKLLDRETFVHIHWMENVFHKSRLIWSLKLAGKFNQNGSNHSAVLQGDSYLFSTKNYFGNQYYISHYSKVSPELAEQFYNVYHERLNTINEKSPQKLEYDKEDFIKYLIDERIDKYILWNRHKQIAGGCLLISKNNSVAAHWVTKEWRLADAYVKLIFVNRGEARFAYLLLFAAATYHLLKRQGTVDNSRILADWSDNINGSRFRQALNIRQVPFLPKLVGVPSGMRPDKIFARLLIGLANFRATLLDNDLYYKITPL